jgi:hypothetical protein
MAKKESLELENSEEIDENICAKKIACYGYDLNAGVWRRLKVDANGQLGVSPQ